MWALCALKATCVYRCQCESCVQRSVWNGYTTLLPCVPYWQLHVDKYVQLEVCSLWNWSVGYVVYIASWWCTSHSCGICSCYVVGILSAAGDTVHTNTVVILSVAGDISKHSCCRWYTKSKTWGIILVSESALWAVPLPLEWIMRIGNTKVAIYSSDS